MELVKKAAALKEIVGSFKKSGKMIGFVPTMGALHEGHLSLVHRSKSLDQFTVVSIFVNPTQFNDKNDLLHYPRMPEKDYALLEKADCNIVFNPEEKEMYPEPDQRVFEFGYLDKIMEGKQRPGHFNGVAQAVTRLFDIVTPNRAYFGMKDFQQLAIIKKIVKDYQYPVEIVPCPIIREHDGLAMSSRNMLLSREQRTHAARISQTLFQAKEMAPACPVKEIKEFVTENLDKDACLKVEYFEIVDDSDLHIISDWSEPGSKTGCIAVKTGNIRLIDNINFSS